MKRSIMLTLFVFGVAQHATADSFDDWERKARKECGGDFETVRLGMDIDRIKHCSSYVAKVSETRRPDGVVSHYRWLNMLLEVEGGKVTAMTRFTR